MSALVEISPQILQEAAQWLVRMQEQPLSEADTLLLERWCNQSAFHAQAWQRAELLKNRLGEIPPEVGLELLNRPQSAARRNAMKHLALLLAVAPASMAAYKLLPWQGWAAKHHTAKGQQQSLQLADGSQLKLNTDSAVDIEFSAQQRLIKLYQGEIYIATAKDARPFLVQTPHGQLRALGTQFVVRKQADDTYIGVLQSAVEIAPKSATQRRIIKAGQQASFTNLQIGQASPLDDNASAWLDGIIYADNMPLSQFIQILARYRTGILQCDASCANVLVSGAFQLNSPDQILAELEKTRPIRIDWKTRYWATLHKK